MFWVPRRPLREAQRGQRETETVVQFTHLQIPCVSWLLINPASLECSAEGKMIEREVAMEHFCRDHGLVSWFEMKSRGFRANARLF